MADSPHSEPEFFARFGFCRGDCDECDRLDREDVKTMTVAEIRAKGVELANRALSKGADRG